MKKSVPMTKLRVLFVCTGNVCRSPTAAAILRKLVSDAGLAEVIEVDSCGIGDSHVGQPPPKAAMDCAEERGYDLSSFRARQVRAADVARFDLVLAMDRGQLNWLRRLKFDEARLRRFLDYATGGKQRKDVPDPFGRSTKAFEIAIDRIETAMPLLLDVLRRDFALDC